MCRNARNARNVTWFKTRVQPPLTYAWGSWTGKYFIRPLLFDTNSCTLLVVPYITLYCTRTQVRRVSHTLHRHHSSAGPGTIPYRSVRKVLVCTAVQYHSYQSTSSGRSSTINQHRIINKIIGGPCTRHHQDFRRLSALNRYRHFLVSILASAVDRPEINICSIYDYDNYVPVNFKLLTSSRNPMVTADIIILPTLIN